LNCIFVNRYRRGAGHHFGICKHLPARFAVAKTCPVEHFHREAVTGFALPAY
jgi:hypothetical protein